MVPVTDGRGNVGYGLGGVQEAPRAAPGLGGRKGWVRPLGQERSVKGLKSETSGAVHWKLRATERGLS